MVRARRGTALWLLIALAFSGCTDPPEGPARSDTDPVVVTAPGDYSYLNSTDPDRPHLHDYWLGAKELLVLDQSVSDIGPGIGGGGSVPIHAFEPDSGHVVPLGTAFVDVTVAWEDATGDMYSRPELWIKTAAENQAYRVAEVDNGATVRFASNNTANDLPHQLLSAWAFEFRLTSPEPPSPFLRFKGEVSMLVVAHRGLDIPLFPAHPDHWRGNVSLPLLDASHTLAYAHDPGDGGCDGVSCQQVHVPASGAIVPPDADHVLAVLEQTEGEGFTIGLGYHGAEARDFQRPAPTTEEGAIRTYRIPVEGFGDGPYARQSQWAFVVVIEGPVEDGVVYASYRLTASAERDAVT